MVEDSCSYSQRENKDCGRYPTCKKTGAAGAASPGRRIIKFLIYWPGAEYRVFISI